MLERKRLVLLVGAIVSVLTLMYSHAYPAGSALAHDLPEIRKSGVLRHLGVPYAHFVSEDGRDGLDVELIKLFADYLGVKYQYVSSSWESVIGDLTGEEYAADGERVSVIGAVPVKGDLIANGFTILPFRQKVLEYSIPIFPTQVWVVARSDCPLNPIHPAGDIGKDIRAVKSLLKGYTVLNKPNTCLDAALYNLGETGATIIKFDGDPNALAGELLKGNVDLSLLDMPFALAALEEWPGKVKIIGPVSQVQNMACAFRKDCPVLRDSFNHFFKKILQDGTYRKLVKKHYPGFSLYYPSYFGAD